MKAILVASWRLFHFPPLHLRCSLQSSQSSTS
ncbi:hypothetical protein F441_14953 [Phytophthora nicotianae CJ01A1]|uniref:Uncharacterized protein n=1 Tax=Phytophthora nicotianae CJ01A1 TaxID=1317063 RepID=W2WHU9_PHYNI|nr:hypothetical protein F441_14953 [Phytophthora nicotianae CJ01A1]